VLRALVSFALLTATLPAQQTTIKTTVPLVVVPVSVTDQRGRFVHGLTTADFLLLDNGEPRSIRVDDAEFVTAGLDLVVLIQTTDISDSALLKIKKIGTMVQDAVVGANGQAAVITFSDRIEVVRTFTSNTDEIANVFRSVRSDDTRKGRLVDAVAEGLDMLAGRPDTARRALLIIGESKDRGSETKLEDLVPALQRSGVTIYGLNYSAYLTPFTTKGTDYSPPEGGSWLDAITEIVHASKQDTCKILTGATGGRMLKFETKSKLENDLIRLGSDIHNRYMVSFTPAVQNAAGYHRIVLEVRDRPELHVQARPGYWASSNQR
jgi:VWFA-related protein